LISELLSQVCSGQTNRTLERLYRNLQPSESPINQYLQRRYHHCKYVVGGDLYVNLSDPYNETEFNFLNSIIDVTGSVHIETVENLQFNTKPPALANLTTIGGQMLQPNEFSLQLAYYGTLRDGIGLNRLRGMLSMYCVISSLLYCKNIKISYSYKSVKLFFKHKCEISEGRSTVFIKSILHSTRIKCT